jgi:hypothetical protein
MNTRILITLCAAMTLLTACAKSEDDKDSSVSVETVPDDTTAPGDQTTTPGGTAGETAATTPGDQPETTNPPPEQ